MNHLLGFNADFSRLWLRNLCVALRSGAHALSKSSVLGRQAIERAGLFQRHGQRLDAISHLFNPALRAGNASKLLICCRLWT